MTHEAVELELHVNNTEAFIAQATKTLGKFHKAGTFNKDRGLAYLDRYCLIPAAKDYHREHGSMTTKWNSVFPKSVRAEVAESLLDQMVNEFRLGNYWE